MAKFISEDDLDKVAAHTVRIEMKDGFIMHYGVTMEAKKALKTCLRNDMSSNYPNPYVWFYVPEDRLVLVNVSEITRITFCFDYTEMTDPVYSDNFNVVDKEDDDLNTDGKLYLPQLIIKHRREKEDEEFVEGVTMKSEGYFGNISQYSSLNIGDVGGFDFSYFQEDDEWILETFRYLRFIDNDGEENYMPLDNLSAIEIERELIMTEELLNKYLGRKPARKTRSKKK